MKLLHIADLHLGKRYNQLSLIDDQRHVLNEILKIADAELPSCVLVAGDVYDKSVPSVQAVELLDWFLSELAARHIKTFIISGNHDSPERIAFGSKLMAGRGVYASPVYRGAVEPITLTDEHGEIDVYMLPFIKPATVRAFFDFDVNDYTEAVRAAVDAMKVDGSKRNVLVAHQFVTGSKSSGSEEFNVGDVGNVDAAVFSRFDYVALGHIHGGQSVGGDRVRYSGTPLAYSLSEAEEEKGVLVVELGEKPVGEKCRLSLRKVPLKPLRRVREIKGTYDELTARSYYEGTTLKSDLLHIVLTDESDVPDALGKLRIIYPYVMSLRYDNVRTREDADLSEVGAAVALSPEEMFARLFELQNNRPLDDEEAKMVGELVEKIWEDGR